MASFQKGLVQRACRVTSQMAKVEKKSKKKGKGKISLGEEAGIAKVIISSISHDFTEPLGQIYTARNLLNKRQWSNADPTELFRRYEIAAEIAQKIELSVEEFVNVEGLEYKKPTTIVRDFSQIVRPYIHQLSDGKPLSLDFDASFEEESLDQAVDEAEVIRLAALQMNNLLRGMKAFSQDMGRPYQKGSRAYQKADPIAFLERIVRLLKVGRENLKIVVRDDWSSAWPNSVEINHGQMRTALQNVISNSIKYSAVEQRIPTIEVGARIAGTSEFSGPLGRRLKDLRWKGDWLVFYVRDNGVGIEKKELSKVQRLSWRGSNVKEVQGQGLGLAIVNAYAVSHGGTFFLESKLDEGTFAQIIIPAVTYREDEVE